MALMKRILICYIVTFFSSILLLSQSKQLDLRLIDIYTHQPISDAHVFVGNTTIGSITDQAGQTSIIIPIGITEDLIISHLSYQTQLIEHENYVAFGDTPTLFLTPNGNDLTQITITAERGRKWKKNLERFKESFLGTDRNAKKCKILNPEVLRFEETQDGHFVVTAVDMLHIENEYLGYDLDFLLNNLTISNDGSKRYLGRAKFTERLNSDNAKIRKNRQVVYEDSPRHFFRSLLKNELRKDKYDLKHVSYVNGEFESHGIAKRDSILSIDSLTGQYELAYTDFLEITNRRNKSVNNQSVGTIGGLESQRFSNSRIEGGTRVSNAVSLLYKLTPEIRLDAYGHILNHKEVQEYGHWANQRIATTLPWDYDMDYSIMTSDTSDILTEQAVDSDAQIHLLKSLVYSDLEDQKAGLNYIDEHWDREYIAPLLEILRLSSDPSLTNSIKHVLQSHEGSKNIPNFYGGLKWLWSSEPTYGDYYANFKGDMYQHIDPKFKTYFQNRQSSATVRIDEVLWGGVKQDGIPPLRYPELISVDEADYLDDDDVIFGMVINGVPKAYPKRILAWHEFVVDAFGDTDIAGVYCTLCGTVIAYDMRYDGVRHELGTSGFLYRSNKLMYDRATQSLWNTIEGTPVIGPLTGQGIKLSTYPVTTTTWGEWKNRHPSSTVLSLNTGHERDYTEGAAYRAYFSNDELMFPVPRLDNRLKNKDEVMVIRSDNHQSDPLAISIQYLKKKRIHHDQINDLQIVIISEPTGASRIYEAKDFLFTKYTNHKLIDESGAYWHVSEEYIESPDGIRLKRIAAHNIYWFAWYNMYPHTRLVK